MTFTNPKALVKFFLRLAQWNASDGAKAIAAKRKMEDWDGVDTNAFMLALHRVLKADGARLHNIQAWMLVGPQSERVMLNRLMLEFAGFYLAGEGRIWRFGPNPDAVAREFVDAHLIFPSAFHRLRRPTLGDLTNCNPRLASEIARSLSAYIPSTEIPREPLDFELAEDPKEAARRSAPAGHRKPRARRK